MPDAPPRTFFVKGVIMASGSNYSGPVLFSYGFRPFFLCAIMFAMVAVPVWLLVYNGEVALHGVFPPVDWHIHEMIFGYGAAVVAGFLFTAIPNWTSRMPSRGWPLAVLSVLWLAGRFTMFGSLSLESFTVMIIDAAFLLAVAAIMTREIVAGRNWRNLKVIVPVTLFWATNVAYHLEVMSNGSANVSRRMGIAVLIFLIMLIGGRIVPSFTKNWLVQRGFGRLPTPFNHFDAVAIAAGAVGLLLWSALPFHALTAVALCVASFLHVVRLSRWQGLATWQSPLLHMLHVAYLFVPLGLLASGLAALSLIDTALGVHLLGIGAIGGMTVAVMMRATMGHTGRDLRAGKLLATAFALVLAAAVWRSFGTLVILWKIDALTLSAAFWCAAFALLAWRLAPWLVGSSRSKF